jgi:RNase adapter protein RapZ
VTKSRPSLPRGAHFVVVTGLSGAGKSHALRALEDLGYFCVDNLPVALIPAFAELSLKGKRRRRAAVVVDVREASELPLFPSVYKRLKRHNGRRIRLVFLEATDAAILRRFSETRRPHPLGSARSVAEGIGEERRLLLPIRRLADQVIDTSRLTVHDLRRRMLESTGDARSVAPLIINVVSFGFRRGTPGDADLIFDVRFLPNPHFVTALRPWTGRNVRVARYVLKTPAARKFRALTGALLKFLVPQYILEGKTYLTIALGCTGGRHRSVAIAEDMATSLRRMKGVQVRVRHRDVEEG